jgi:hypothetical protein
MTVRRQKRRDPKTGAVREFWIVDLVLAMPSGETKRIRRVSPVQTSQGARQHERELCRAFQDGSLAEEEVRETRPPTVADFYERFLNVYAKPNNKPSEVVNKRQTLTNHIVPFFGSMRLDQIGFLEIEQYKAAKLQEELSAKTINNHLATLGRLLTVAHPACSEDEVAEGRGTGVRLLGLRGGDAAGCGCGARLPGDDRRRSEDGTAPG